MPKYSLMEAPKREKCVLFASELLLDSISGRTKKESGKGAAKGENIKQSR